MAAVKGEKSQSPDSQKLGHIRLTHGSINYYCISVQTDVCDSKWSSEKGEGSLGRKGQGGFVREEVGLEGKSSSWSWGQREAMKKAEASLPSSS